MTERKLVRLRTAPMPDPGEWCYGPQSYCQIYDHEFDCCPLDRDIALRGPERYLRRPQSCIDAAEEVEM